MTNPKRTAYQRAYRTGHKSERTRAERTALCRLMRAKGWKWSNYLTAFVPARQTREGSER